MDVLYLDNHLLVVTKPAGLLVQGDDTGDPDLLTEGKLFLKARFNKPGNVFLGLVHRLDRPVSGVVVFARTSKAASRLSAQFRERTVEKTYLALVEGWLAESTELKDYLRKGRRRTEVVKATKKGAKEARLACRPLKVIGKQTLVEVELETGRSHQIRVQLAQEGHPVVGDLKYGAKAVDGSNFLGLHGWKIEIDHPVSRERMQWAAPLPDSWPAEIRTVL